MLYLRFYEFFWCLCSCFICTVYFLLVGTIIELSCRPGTYQANKGQFNCTTCDVGSMCPDYNMTRPVECKPGYFCPGGTTMRCPPGTYNNQTGSSLSGACIDCIQGMFCPGQGNIMPYGICQIGYYCQGGASSKAPNTSHPRYPLNGPCPPGYYCPAGTAAPVKCPRGTYRNNTGARYQSECLPCKPGSYCQTYGLTSPTNLCLEGWYCPDQYNNTESTPHNFTCPVGHYCPNGTALPKECETG